MQGANAAVGYGALALGAAAQVNTRQHAASQRMSLAQIGPLPTRPIPPSAAPHSAAVNWKYQGSADQVLMALSRLYQQDKSAEKHAKLMLWAGVISIIIGVFTFAVIVGFIFLGIGAILLIWRIFVKKHDIEDRKLEVASGLLLALRDELRPGRPVRVAIDFSGFTNHPSMPPQKNGYKTTHSYQHWWFSMEFMLLDGTSAIVDVVQFAKRRTTPKRKYTKYQDRTSERVRVRLVPPRGKYFGARAQQLRPTQATVGGVLTPLRAQVQPRSADLQYRSGRSLRVSGRGGWTVRDVRAELDSFVVLSALMYSYRLLASEERRAS